MGRALQPRRGTSDTGEGQRIFNTWEEQRHDFLITLERVGIEGAEAMEKEGGTNFKLHGKGLATKASKRWRKEGGPQIFKTSDF